jgi:hypothetical protein
VWNFVEVDMQDVSLAPGDLFWADDSTEAAVDASNAVLRAVTRDTFNQPTDPQQPVNFRQLDYDAPQAGSIDGNNSRLDSWSRQVSWFDMPVEDLPSVVRLPDSRLAYSDETVLAEIVLQRVTMLLSLVAHRECRRRGFNVDCNTETNETIPFARFRIIADCALRISLPDGTQELAPVSQPVVYVDQDDREFIPRTRVQWWGMLGHFSDPETENIAGDNPNLCLGLAEGLSGLKIPGWPWMSDADPRRPNQLYKGKVVLNFKTSNYFDCLGGAAGVS